MSDMPENALQTRQQHMPVMRVKQAKCGFCDKVAREVSREIVGSYYFKKLECGHTICEDAVKALEESKYTDLESSDGKSLYPFQIETVKFAEKSNFRCLIAHEMGLGKTIIALAALKLHPELLPCIIVCKSSLTAQWFVEIHRWTGKVAQVITKSTDDPEPNFFDIFIVSYDMLRRVSDKLKNGTGKITTIIFDETQMIKNTGAARTRFALDLCQKADHVIGLSGTPIKNHAGEYYPILHAIMPERFLTQAGFFRMHVQGYYDRFGNAHVGGLKDPAYFQRLTKDNIIRYEREEVMPQLPKVNRTFLFFDMAAAVQRTYDTDFAEFKKAADRIDLGNAKFDDYTSLLAWMAKMRHACGYSKIEPCAEFVSQFIEENDRPITIFVHHNDVGDILEAKLRSLLPNIGIKRLKADSSDRDEIIQNCTRYGWWSQNPNDRILIASTLAAGEGINLQACSDAIILERQWNPANEEQAEARFTRIGSVAKQVNICYMLVISTIDEYLSELVEKKREICRSTYGNETVPWEETSLMKELMNTLLVKGQKRFKLPSGN